MLSLLENKLDLVNLEMPYALVNYNRITIQTISE